MTPAPKPEVAHAALRAAQLASAVAAELIGFSQEDGAASRFDPFSEAEPITRLVEALALVAEIDRSACEAAGGASEEIEQLGQLIAALRAFHWNFTGAELPDITLSATETLS